jgi:hypothetical protein
LCYGIEVFREQTVMESVLYFNICSFGKEIKISFIGYVAVSRVDEVGL